MYDCNQERRTTHARDFGKTFDWAGFFSEVRIRAAVLPTLPQLREINVGNRIERVIKIFGHRYCGLHRYGSIANINGTRYRLGYLICPGTTCAAIIQDILGNIRCHHRRRIIRLGFPWWWRVNIAEFDSIRSGIALMGWVSAVYVDGIYFGRTSQLSCHAWVLGSITCQDGDLQVHCMTALDSTDYRFLLSTDQATIVAKWFSGM
jgi:hypothetical protein